MMMKQYKWIKPIYIKHVSSKIDLQFNMLQIWSLKENKEKNPVFCTLVQVPFSFRVKSVS